MKVKKTATVYFSTIFNISFSKTPPPSPRRESCGGISIFVNVSIWLVMHHFPPLDHKHFDTKKCKVRKPNPKWRLKNLFPSVQISLS